MIEKWKKKFANIKNKIPADSMPVTRSGKDSKNEGVGKVCMRGVQKSYRELLTLEKMLI